MRLFVTGFGPFLEVAENPSAVLARGSGLPFEILEVAFRAVDEWIAALDPDTFDAWLMLGVSGSAKTSTLENVAHNRIGRTPDARNEVWGLGPIAPDHHAQLASTLWQQQEFLVDSPDWVHSLDAGSYLCNYLLYQGLRTFPSKRVGFLHVPTVEALPFGLTELQVQRVVKLLTVG